VDSAPDGTVTLDDTSDTHWRNLTWFSASVGYWFTKYLQGSLVYRSLTTHLDPNGSRRNPFWNPDSVVALRALVLLDQLYTKVRGQPSVAKNENGSPATAEGAKEDEHAQASSSQVWF
jgi:hypothetical protein